MNCPSCGKQVQQGDSFCMHCGALLAHPAQPAAGVEPVSSAPPDTAPWQTATGFGAEARADQHAALPPAAEAGPGDNEAAWAPPSEPRRSTSGRWLGLLALLLVLFGLAAAGGYLLQRTVFRGNDGQPGEAATAQPLQPPVEEQAALESTQSQSQPPDDPNTPDPSPSVPAESPSDPPAASSSAANEGANSARPDAARKGSPVPTTPSKQSGNSAAIAPQGSATPQSKVAVSSAGQATKIAPAANQTASAQGTVPASGAAEQPRPAPRQEAAPAASASEAAVAGGTAQPHTASPAETTIAAATNETAAATTDTAAASETAATRPRTPRNEVFRPDAQPPRPAASQSQSASSAAAGGLPSPAPAPQPTEEGIIYWTGRLTKNQVIVIEQGKASIGMADGGLPAIPVDVWLPSPAVTLVERPASQNNWSRVAFRCLQSTNRNVTLNIQWKRLR